MYSVTNFIKTYSSSDTCIVFQDITGKVTNGINVCKYLDVRSSNDTLWVTLSGNLQVILNFSTTSEAQQAVVALRSTLDTLYPNCAIQTPIPGPPISVLNITVNNYIVHLNAGTLIPLQYYDVTDTNNAFGQGAGQVFRVLSLTTTDSTPRGIICTTEEKVCLNFINLSIEEGLLVSQHLITTGESQISNDDNSNFLTATNQSSITSVNSNYVEANNSIVTVDTCNHIVIENSNVTLANSNNVIIKDLKSLSSSVVDLSMYTLENIQVDLGTSIGKQGRENLNTTNSEVLQAYARFIYQVVSSLSANLIKLLDTPFVNSNATFKFLVPVTLNGHTLTIKNKNGTTLKVISDAYVGKEVSFIYNTSTLLFESVLEDTSLTKKVTISVITLGQTTFTNATSYPPISPTTSLLFINGVEQRYMTDYYFNNSDLVWTNASFILETTDIVELQYN